MYRNARYVNGAAAPEIEYDVYKAHPKLREYKRHKKRRRVNFRLVMLIATLTLLVGFVIYRYNYIAEINFKIDEAKKQYNTIRNENTLLKVGIEKNLNLNKIRSEATKSLSMQKPSHQQKVYIAVNTKDFATSMSNADEKGEDSNFFSLMARKFKVLLGLL